MPKRFTATEKWSDPWFRGLSPRHKLAWLYLCDVCDIAGVVDLDRGLADFQVGDTLDWDGLIEAAAGRITRLDGGKLWLNRFIEFQYGVLEPSNRIYGPVRKILDKYSLNEGASKGHRRGCNPPKDKDKDKDKDIKKGGAGGKHRVTADMVPVPSGWDTAGVLQAIGDWLDYKATRGEPYKDAGFIARKVKEFERLGPSAFIAAVNSSIGSNYAGLFPAKESGNGKARRCDNSAIGSGGRERSL